MTKIHVPLKRGQISRSGLSPEAEQAAGNVFAAIANDAQKKLPVRSTYDVPDVLAQELSALSKPKRKKSNTSPGS